MLTITETTIESDLCGDRAVYRPHAAADGRGAWVATTRPRQLLRFNQAVSAMTIAEEQARPDPDRRLIAALESELPA